MQYLFGVLILLLGETLIGRQQPQRHLIKSAQSNQQFVIGTIDATFLQQRPQDILTHQVNFLLMLEEQAQVCLATGLKKRLRLMRTHRTE